MSICLYEDGCMYATEDFSSGYAVCVLKRETPTYTASSTYKIAVNGYNRRTYEGVWACVQIQMIEGSQRSCRNSGTMHMSSECRNDTGGGDLMSKSLPTIFYPPVKSQSDLDNMATFLSDRLRQLGIWPPREVIFDLMQKNACKVASWNKSDDRLQWNSYWKAISFSSAAGNMTFVDFICSCFAKGKLTFALIFVSTVWNLSWNFF